MPKHDSHSLVHKWPRPRAQKPSVVLCPQIRSSVGLPPVLAWKFRGFCLADVAGVHSEASPLESSAPLQGRWFCGCVVRVGPYTVCPLGYKTHRSRNPAHVPRGANKGVSSGVSRWMWWEKAGLCPVEMEGGSGRKAESALEKEPLHAAQGWHKWVRSLDSASPNTHLQTFSWSSADQRRHSNDKKERS